MGHYTDETWGAQDMLIQMSCAKGRGDGGREGDKHMRVHVFGDGTVVRPSGKPLTAAEKMRARQIRRAVIDGKMTPGQAGASTHGRDAEWERRYREAVQ